ncbi:hypothetical protein ACFT7S_17220 [Streptomyces sp. NPDC057136]|uniref:hypothetical protein n=1 Tax=Streptomyces sp. NPDC057136 TaxID=3346029 RepID=UPI00362708D2
MARPGPSVRLRPGRQRYVGAHVADYGWLGATCDGGTSGAVGLKKAIEALEASVGGVGVFCFTAHLCSVGRQGEPVSARIARSAGQGPAPRD